MADLAGLLGQRAASSGWRGATIAQPSMKICAPICSATACAVGGDRARGGAATPFLRFSQAVCSVELPLPPHHRIERSSTM